MSDPLLTRADSTERRWRFTVLVARQSNQAESLLNMVSQTGGRGFAFPLIEVKFAAGLQIVQCLQNAVLSAQVIVATSANALRALAQVKDQAGLTLPKTCYVVGEASARAAANLGFSPVYYEHIKTGKQLAGHLLKVLPQGIAILYPHGNLADEVVPQILRQAGHHVTECTCYTTEDAILDENLLHELGEYPPIFVVLYSPSAARSLYQNWKTRVDMAELRVISIGPTTAAACKALGITVAGVANAPTDAGVFQVITGLLHNS